jgi:hypothetical protein
VDEAAAIRRRIETEPWAKRQYEAMLKEKGLGETFRFPATTTSAIGRSPRG